jgi:hypothetical protein
METDNPLRMKFFISGRDDLFTVTTGSPYLYWNKMPGSGTDEQTCLCFLFIHLQIMKTQNVLKKKKPSRSRDGFVWRFYLSYQGF